MIINSPEISILISSFWKNRNDIEKIIRTYKFSPEYAACSARFPKWEKLLNEACKEILGELKNFKPDQLEYVVQKDRIGYKDQDSIVFNLNYGYKTLFTYLLENANGNISLFSLDQNMGFLIRLGSFSYAEIPLENFCSILGVTGIKNCLFYFRSDWN